MNTKALLMATATLLALSAVSCGNDDTTESSVSISLSEEKTTEESSEETTSATSTENATTTTSSSSTDTSDTATTDSSTVSTDTATTTSTTSVPQQEETVQQEENEQTDVEVNNDNNENQDNQQDNNQQDNNNDNNVDNENNGQTNEPQKEEVKFNIDFLLSDAKDIISNLGTPVYEGGGAACLTNGHDDKIYQYDGLEIQCYVDGDKEYIFQINITGGDYQTDKGIKVGSSRTDVESAYGTGTESGNMIIYSSGNNEMDIQYNDSGDTVISIFFYTPV